MDKTAFQLADVNFESMWAFAAIILLWAAVRPSTVRDHDNRPLPFSFTPRLFVVLIYGLTYLLLVATVYSFPDVVTKVLGSTFYGDYAKYVQSKAPFLAMFALGTLMTLAPVREIERAFLVWAHSAQNLHADALLLARHLRLCAFSPSRAERQRSVDELKAFNFFVTDSGTQTIELASVNYWRKVTSLVRLLNEWSKSGTSMLNAAEVRQLEEITVSHERKTQLALNIVRMLNHLSRGEGAQQTLQDITDLIATIPHADRARVAEIEGRLRALVSPEEPHDASLPVRMSSRQLQGYLAQIQDYFVVEYQVLVEQIAMLAAKSIVLSGSHAPERLEMLKSVGFKGIGSIEPVRFDRVLVMFLGILCAGFLIFFATRYPLLQQQLENDAMTEASRRLLQQYQLYLFLSLSMIMAFAALFGAIFGSSKAHARGRYAPWHVYLGAGLLSVVVFFAVHGARLTYFGDSVSEVRQLRQEMRVARNPESARGTVAPRADEAPVSTSSTSRSEEEESSSLEMMYRIAPFSVLPFLATVALCWLARQRRWPRPSFIANSQRGSAVWERFWDGLALALVCLIAYLGSRGLRELMGFPSRGSRNLINWQFVAPLLGLGFLIGATVVREARSAAHAQIVDIDGPSRSEAEAATVVTVEAPAE
jgi:hypothetical protein